MVKSPTVGLNSPAFEPLQTPPFTGLVAEWKIIFWKFFNFSEHHFIDLVTLIPTHTNIYRVNEV